MGLIFGYDTVISGGVTSMDSFLLEFSPCVRQGEGDQRLEPVLQVEAEHMLKRN
jgi:hypothetical protein